METPINRGRNTAKPANTNCSSCTLSPEPFRNSALGRKFRSIKVSCLGTITATAASTGTGQVSQGAGAEQKAGTYGCSLPSPHCSEAHSTHCAQAKSIPAPAQPNPGVGTRNARGSVGPAMRVLQGSDQHGSSSVLQPQCQVYPCMERRPGKLLNCGAKTGRPKKAAGK